VADGHVSGSTTPPAREGTAARPTVVEEQSIPAMSSNASEAQNTGLRIIRSSYSIRPVQRRNYSSTVLRGRRDVGVPSDLQPYLRDVEWQLRLHNAGHNRILSFSYEPEFLDASGDVVPRALGLGPSDGFNAWMSDRPIKQAPVEIRSMESFRMTLRVGEVRDVILHELVTQDAARQIRKARITIKPTWETTKR